MPADAWAALAQWATVAVAVVAAAIALRQVNEARKTRKRVIQPDVVVFADHNPTNWQYLDIVIKNFGQTTAYNIKVKMTLPDVSPYHSLITGQNVGVTKLYIPEDIAVLAPGQEWRTVWDSAIKRKEHADKLSDNDVTGMVTFWDKMNDDPNAKPPYRNRIWVDPKMYRNMLRLSSIEPAQKISEEIGKVASTLEGYNKQRGGVWVYAVPGDEERMRRDDDRRRAKQAHDEIIAALTPEEQQQQRRRVD